MGDLITVGSSRHRPAVMARWALLLSAAYLILYGSSTPLPLWPHRALAVAIVMANCLMTGSFARNDAHARWRWTLTVVDVLTLIAAIGVAGPSTDFFLFFFLVMLLAGFSHGVRVMVSLTLAVCAVYAALLYLAHGPDIWRRTEELIRLPFLFGAAIFFGTITEEARRERQRAERFSSVAQHMVRRFRQVATERDRTQALLEISRTALSTKPPGDVLNEITSQIRETVHVDRCSLIVFGDAGREGYLAACTDDPNHDVHLCLSVEEYPEIQQTLASGEITEVHADDPNDLWVEVVQHLPKTHRYLSSTIVPLLQNDNVVGVLFLRDRREDSRFNDEERVFCSTAATMTAAYLQGCDLLEEMRRRSREDGLTQLLNFRTFREELNTAVDELADGDPLSLVMVDIDDMKQINDHCGHAVGSETICAVGRLLAEALPDALAICRYGGDEFIAACPTPKEEVEAWMEQLLSNLDALAPTSGHRPRVSIGIAGYREDSADLEQLIEMADQAMYLAKSEGGHCVRMADGAGDSWNGRVFEAVISVNARRLVPGETKAFRGVLNELLRMEEAQLDSGAVRQSLHSLMEAVESKDPYTSEHSREVSELSRHLAAAMGLSERETLAVEIAGLVHDVGKIGIPDGILQKEGKLTAEERAEIERHPEIGAQILRPLPGLEEVLPIVLYHQERWDGTGYPEGLAGDAIPLGAQIVAICDVFHALTSDRAYRSAYPVEKACSIIRQGVGSHWSPAVAAKLLEIAGEMDAGRQASRKLAA